MTRDLAAPVLIAESNGVLQLTLNRPEVRNALNGDVVRIIAEQVAEAGRTPRVRVVALRGAGSVFSAGVDLARLKSLGSSTREQHIEDALTHCNMLRAIVTCEKPVIALVHGSVHGGAVGLACAADLVIAEAGTRFSTAEARVGLAPVLLAPYFAAAIGDRLARYHLLTGEPIEAERAVAIGLVHKVVPAGGLDDAVRNLVEAIRRGGPRALGMTKRVLSQAGTLPLEEAEMLRAAEQIADARLGVEAKEGISAFLEKRSPVWTAA